MDRNYREFKIGSTEERITSNPYIGVLFKSADQKAWLPQRILIYI